MKWAALIAWVVTAGGGFVLLSIWLARGGMQQAQEAGNRIRPPLILSHFLLAAGGLVVWIIYLISDNDALAWIAFAILAVVAVLGFTMFAIWLRRRQAATGVGPKSQRPAFLRNSTSRSRSWGCMDCLPSRLSCSCCSPRLMSAAPKEARVRGGARDPLAVECRRR